MGDVLKMVSGENEAGDEGRRDDGIVAIGELKTPGWNASQLDDLAARFVKAQLRLKDKHRAWLYYHRIYNHHDNLSIVR